MQEQDSGCEKEAYSLSLLLIIYLLIVPDDGGLRHSEVKRSPQGHMESLLVTGHSFKGQLQFGNIGIFDAVQFSRKTNPNAKGHSVNKFAW